MEESKVKLSVDIKRSPSVYRWEEIRTPPPHPSRRSYHAAAAWGDRLIIVGGQDLREGPQSGVWMITFSEGIEQWEEVDTQPFGPLYRATAIVYEEELILFGGTTGDHEFNRVLSFKLPSFQWNEVLPHNNQCPPPLDSHTANLYETEGQAYLVVFGGYIEGARTSNVYMMKLDNKEWTFVENSGGPPPRSNHCAVVYKDSLIIFGGADEEGEKLNDVWRFDLVHRHWEPINTQGEVPSARSGHSGILYKNSMIVFGGMKDITKETNEVFYLDLDTWCWSLVQDDHQIIDPVSPEKVEEYKKAKSPAKAGSPGSKSPTKFPNRSGSPRSPTKGGNSPSDVPNSGKKKKTQNSLYDGPPAPLIGRVRGNVPHPRDGHSAVLVGDNMIIFGGDRHQMPFNDLYAYSLRS